MVLCWAPNCRHYNVRETCRFFVFPKDKEERSRWIQLLGRSVEPGIGARVCSCHFREGIKENGPEIFDGVQIRKIEAATPMTSEEIPATSTSSISEEWAPSTSAALSPTGEAGFQCIPYEMLESKMEEDRDLPWDFHTCQFGPYRSKSAFIMYQHIRQHQERSKIDTFTCESKSPEMFECEFCEFSSNLKVDLTEHRRVFHEGKEANEELGNILKCNRCKNCDFETHSVLVLTKHVRCCVHRNDSSKEYGTIPKIFVNENENWYEFRSAEGVKWLQCKYCEYKASHASYMNQHIHVEPEVISLFKCDQCPFEAKQRSRLKVHIEQKHDIYWFRCSHCAFKTKLKFSLKSHFTVKHLPDDLIEWCLCQYCAYKAKTKAYLERHVINNHTQDIEWFRCSQCKYKTKIKNYLQTHMTKKHVKMEDITWLQCKQCKFKTRKSQTLKGHALAKHSDPESINWIKCTQCEYKATTKSSVTRHFKNKHIK